MNMLYDFSSALLQARQRKGVTQEQIAFSLDISQATYNAGSVDIAFVLTSISLHSSVILMTNSLPAACFEFSCLCSIIWQD